MNAVEAAQAILKDKYDHMVNIFFDDTIIYIEEINAAAESRRFNDAIRPAHTIKSSSLRMGALALSQQAYEIEFFLKEYEAKNFDHFNQQDLIRRAIALRSTFCQTKDAFHLTP